MSELSKSLMKLVSLTKEQRGLGPIVQQYVQQKYGVDNMTSFAKEDIAGVDDKDALYEQWVAWIENDQLDKFKLAEQDDNDNQAEAADEETAEISVAATAASDEATAEVKTPTHAMQAESSANSNATAAASVKTDKDKNEPQQKTATGKLDSLVNAMIQQALTHQPEAQQPLTEERVREIVKEEVKHILQSAFK